MILIHFSKSNNYTMVEHPRLIAQHRAAQRSCYNCYVEILRIFRVVRLAVETKSANALSFGVH